MTTGQLGAGCRDAGLCESDGRSESTAAPLPGPAGPVLRRSLPTPSGKLPRGAPQRRSQPWDERAKVVKDQTPKCTPNLTLPSLNQAGRGVLGQGQTRRIEKRAVPSLSEGTRRPYPGGSSPAVSLSQPRAPRQPGVSAHIPFLKSQRQSLWLVSVSFQQICPQASVPAGQGFLPSSTHLFVQNILFQNAFPKSSQSAGGAYSPASVPATVWGPELVSLGDVQCEGLDPSALCIVLLLSKVRGYFSLFFLPCCCMFP